jgi:hypothetical protein
VLASLVAVLLVIVAFQALPAFAATAKGVVKERIGKKRGGSSFFKKVIDGANAKGNLPKMKAGDTRSEFATLINSFSAFFFLAALGLASTVFTGVRDFADGIRAKKEVKRVNEYKENMYFEAVEEVLAKLAEPSLKGSSKSSLLRQLKELDPDGRIAKFLKEGGARPDMSDLTNTKPKQQKQKRAQESKSKPAPPKEEAVTPDHDDVVAESFSEPDEPYEELLVALYESLSGSLKESSRQLLRDTLRGRIERIADSEKRNATVRKIAERLGDTEYWINYANKLSDG